MSLDCVTPAPPGAFVPFTLLPQENIIYVSPDRVLLHLNPTHLTNEIKRGTEGKLYVTSHRLVYIGTGKNDFQNFVLLFNKNLFDFRLESSWFGSNKFSFLFRPTFENSGLNHLYTWKGLCFFNNGGITEFVQAFNKAYNEWKYGQNGEQLPQYTE